MQQEILYLLLDNYAEHELAFLASALNCDADGIRQHPAYLNRIVARSSAPVKSCGGFRILPDYTFDTMPDDYAALILIGGYDWSTSYAQKLSTIVEKAVHNHKIVGAICNAASFLARHGFLNHVRHTGNGLEQLQLWGGEHYTNAAGYVEAQAVSDGNIVTANGTGQLEFACEILRLLEADTPQNIEMYYQFNKLGYIEFSRRN